MRYLCFLILLMSCSQTKVFLQKENLVPFKEFSSVTKVDDHTKFLSIKSVSDNREDPEHIGVALTGISYNPTPVSLGISVADYTKQFLVDALRQRGMALDEINGVKLDVIIKELWIVELIEKYRPERAQCKANLSFHIQGENASWEGQYWTDIISPGDMADGTTKIAPTLASCMNEIVEQLIKDKAFINNLK